MNNIDAENSLQASVHILESYFFFLFTLFMKGTLTLWAAKSRSWAASNLSSVVNLVKSWLELFGKSDLLDPDIHIRFFLYFIFIESYLLLETDFYFFYQ